MRASRWGSVTVPGLTPVASPWLPLVLLTVATVLSDVDHVTWLVRSSVEFTVVIQPDSMGEGKIQSR